MAPNETTTSTGSGGGSKISSAEMAREIRSKQAEIHEAAHTILRNAGLSGVSVHDVHFNVDPEGLSDPGCDDCDLTENTCVLTRSGWVCKPNP